MKLIHISLILASGLSLLLASCEKDNADTANPTVVISSPQEEEALKAGEEIHFEADFADNVELKSYKVDIHSNFNHHTHKSAQEDSAAWVFQQSWNFDQGQKEAHIHHHEITIPTEIEGKPVATGDYHFMVYCTDAAGNETWQAVGIEIHR